MEVLNNGNIDNSMDELLQVFVGFASIKKDPSTRERIIKELEKTDLYQEVIVRPSKEN
jgi:hypothetical protein